MGELDELGLGVRGRGSVLGCDSAIDCVESELDRVLLLDAAGPAVGAVADEPGAEGLERAPVAGTGQPADEDGSDKQDHDGGRAIHAIASVPVDSAPVRTNRQPTRPAGN